MIKLGRDNVVKTVDSEEKAALLEREGFTRITEPEPLPGDDDAGDKPPTLNTGDGDAPKMGGKGKARVTASNAAVKS
jgi:hypothetical protein